MSESKLWRVDPEGCGCTDCLIGESKPIDQCSQRELVKLYYGEIDNASGREISATIKIEIN